MDMWGSASDIQSFVADLFDATSEVHEDSGSGMVFSVSGIQHACVTVATSSFVMQLASKLWMSTEDVDYWLQESKEQFSSTNLPANQPNDSISEIQVSKSKITDESFLETQVSLFCFRLCLLRALVAPRPLCSP